MKKEALTLTKGNVDDRKPVANLTKKLTGLLFGDKGYIKKELFQELFDRLVTNIKKGIKIDKESIVYIDECGVDSERICVCS
jgi:hypothetical protein